MLQDIPDIEGDKIFGIRSFSVTLGQKPVNFEKPNNMFDSSFELRLHTKRKLGFFLQNSGVLGMCFTTSNGLRCRDCGWRHISFHMEQSHLGKYLSIPIKPR